MKHSLKTLFIFCLSFLFFAACSDSEKKVANGYTEEQNATNLDSAAYARLMTWEPKVALKTVKVDDAEFGKSWYEIQFTTAGNSYYKYTGKTVEDACTVDLYAEQNGVRMNLTRVYKKDVHTEFLSRDSLDAVVEDHLDNTYEGDSAVANCQADSTAFVDYCSDIDGTLTDLFKSKCTVLHLTCVAKFKPQVTASEYLLGTAQKMKDRCIAEFYAPGEKFEDENLEEGDADKELAEEPEEKEPAEEDSTLLVDERDGHVYKTVKIGDQTWMAENLNYAYLGKTALWDSSSFCYKNDPANCEKHGRLYIWSAALDSAGLLNDDAKGCGLSAVCLPRRNVQGVCPDGWRVPNYDDWDALVTYAGDVGTAGGYLKAEEYGGTDDYGFSILLSGSHTEFAAGGDGADGGLDSQVGFVTLTEKDSSSYSMMQFTSMGNFYGEGFFSSKYIASPLRCVKGEATEYPIGAFAPGKVKVGSLTDTRDGHVYKTVTIDSKVWMAENLNYDEGAGSLCYENDEANCDKYGRYYSDPSLKLCPDGWHIPSSDEFENLHRTIGFSFAPLKSTSGWSAILGNGTNLYSFNLMPNGMGMPQNGEVEFVDFGLDAHLLTSTERPNDTSNRYFYFSTNVGGSGWYCTNTYKGAERNYLNVRCLKD